MSFNPQSKEDLKNLAIAKIDSFPEPTSEDECNIIADKVHEELCKTINPDTTYPTGRC